MIFDAITKHIKSVMLKSKDAYMEGRYEVDRSMMDALDELGLPYHADMKQVKKRYFELCKEFHPDSAKTINNERFLRVKEAYDTLKAAFQDKKEEEK